MYKCEWCGAVFDEPDEHRYTEKHPYGEGYAEEEFLECTCPECGCEDLEEVFDYDE